MLLLLHLLHHHCQISAVSSSSCWCCKLWFLWDQLKRKRRRKKIFLDICKERRSSQKRQHIQFWVQNRQFCSNMIAVWIWMSCVCRSQNTSCVFTAQQKICYKQTAVWVHLLLLFVCQFLFWWDACQEDMLFHHKCF